MDAKPPYLSVGPFGASTTNRDPDAQAAEITALRAELADARLQIAGGDMLIHAANLERDALAARLAVPGEEADPIAWKDDSGDDYRLFRVNTPIGFFAYGTDRAGVSYHQGPDAHYQGCDHPTEAAAREAAEAAYRSFAEKTAADLGLCTALRSSITALRARVAGLERALTTLLAGDYPRPLGERWRADGEPSNHDRCTHGAMMNEPCETCADAFISAALSPSAAQEARDA